MPMKMHDLTRWIITSERNRELAWVTLDEAGVINVSIGLGMIDSPTARDLANVLITAADLADNKGHRQQQDDSDIPF